MAHKELEAPEEISNSVNGFWYRDINLREFPSDFEVLPDGHAEIIFHFGTGCGLRLDDRIEPLPSPFIVGLLKQPTFFHIKHRLQIIGIKCLPWAVYDFLNIPSITGGVHTFKHPIALLQTKLQQLLDLEKIDEALILVSDWFVNNNIGLPSSVAALNKAGRAMLKAKGAMPVSSVAAAANATFRTLERKFKSSSGHTIKDVSGLIRFEQVRNCLWDNPDAAIAGLAHDLGYADQSHLNRAFKRYSGMTAAAFAKQTKTRKLDFGNDFVAIVLSS